MIDDNANDAVSRIATHIITELAQSLGQTNENIDPDLPFIDMGADSLILAEALQSVNRLYRVALPISEIYDHLNTIGKLARHIAVHGQWREVSSEGREVSPDAFGPLPGAIERAPSMNGDKGFPASVNGEAVELIVRQQLDLMERQLALLSDGKPVNGALRVVSAQPESARLGSRSNQGAGRGASADPTKPIHGNEADRGDRFSAFSIKLDNDARKDDAAKLDHIRQLTARFNQKTSQSKQMAQAYRRVLADNRVSAGFRPLLKEMVYPVLAEQGQGARLVDIDGNEYVDFTMGFGVHLFGHAPGFVTSAIQEQLTRGMPIGPQSPLAGRVAELISELTGQERVVFCNSGTEATMTAVRLARAKSGKDKIVIFRNSYHGTFDGFLARTGSAGESAKPASLGTPASLVRDTIVLDYGSDASLREIERRQDEIGVVLVEPVQSRAPSLQPRAFLEALRRITRDGAIALIFDEVISGFRCAPGGAQQYFGVKADLCTFGKIIGGGMPIGVVAGTSTFMDGVDGGWWQYEDDSYPTASTIFFAGTFSKHPLAMAAAVAVLERVKAEGHELYPALNEKTGLLCERLDQVFEAAGVDIKVEHFSSLFRFTSKGNIDLFFYHLLDRGIYIWEGRNCFVSTAHQAADLDHLVAAIQDICQELAPLQLLPLTAATTQAAARRAAEPFSLSDAQQRFLELERLGVEGSIACNICFGFHFKDAVDATRLLEASRTALIKHEALWYRLDAALGVQQVMAARDDCIRHVALDEAGSVRQIDQLMAEEQKIPFDLAAGEGLRVRIYSFADGSALLGFCAHHLLCDGWALNILLHQIATLYNGGTVNPTGGIDLPYSEWIEHERRYKADERYDADREFWVETMKRIVIRQRGEASDAVRHQQKVGPRTGGRASFVLDEAVTGQLITQAKNDGVTPFTWLLACFQVFLNKVYRQQVPVIGIPFANRTGKLRSLVGTCVNLVPLLPLQANNVAFTPALADTKRQMSDLLVHSRFPYHEMCEIYRAIASSDQQAPVDITFNVEPLTEMPKFGHVAPVLLAPANDRIEFDLMFNLFLMEGGLRIELDYNRDLFAEDLLYGWLYLFAKIIENQSAALAPEQSGPPAHSSASPPSTETEFAA